MKTTLLLLPISLASATDWKTIVDTINNNKASTWKATMPSDRDIHRSLDLVGGYKSFEGTLPMFKVFDKASTAPDEYDNRLGHPFCPSIRTVRDQCGCGSCFAFGSVEAFEDVGFIICYY